MKSWGGTGMVTGEGKKKNWFVVFDHKLVAFQAHCQENVKNLSIATDSGRRIVTNVEKPFAISVVERLNKALDEVLRIQ